MLNEVKEQLKSNYIKQEDVVAFICDTYMGIIFDNFKEGNSIKYEEYPLMKSKIRVPTIPENSPRIPRNKSAVVMIKIPLFEKEDV